MNCMMIFMAAATLGVDVGWQRQQNGELEYIIQIEPQLIESLKEGKILTSGIRPALRDIRRYRIVVGTGKLPQEPSLEELKLQADIDTSSDTQQAVRPRTFHPNGDSKPMVKQAAAYDDASKKDRKDNQTGQPKTNISGHTTSTPIQEAAKPWFPLTLVLLGLFGSLGANIYMGWVTLGTRKRYQTLLREAHGEENLPAL
ncbi:MAG: hypothetical protein IH991_16435 [Planctomycetes bacterium]|nr:hypothetical protein [Planctomycetota bacterium]